MAANVYNKSLSCKFLCKKNRINMKNIINFAIIMSEPLAERMRPRTLDDYVGQQHLVGPGAVLRKMIDTGHISSFILWGPPGVGKTTLAQIVANMLQVPFTRSVP